MTNRRMRRGRMGRWQLRMCVKWRFDTHEAAPKLRERHVDRLRKFRGLDATGPPSGLKPPAEEQLDVDGSVSGAAGPDASTATTSRGRGRFEKARIHARRGAGGMRGRKGGNGSRSSAQAFV